MNNVMNTFKIMEAVMNEVMNACKRKNELMNTNQ